MVLVKHIILMCAKNYKHKFKVVKVIQELEIRSVE